MVLVSGALGEAEGWIWRRRMVRVGGGGRGR